MLTALIVLPFLGALALGFFPGMLSERNARLGAIAVAAVVFLINLWLLIQFDLNNAGFQFKEYFAWIPAIGLNYSLAVDGLSLPLITLGNFLTLLVAIGGDVGLPKDAVFKKPRLFYSLVLLVNAGVTGAFVAQNLLLFVLFYEIELIPFYLLIAIWGGVKKDYAAMKFLIYTAVSGILILAAFLALTWLSGSPSFDYGVIKTAALSQKLQLIILTTLLVGFGIKIPLVPLHTWLPDAYVEASPPIAILLGGVLAKLGTYGLVRFCIGLFPDAWKLVAPGVAILASSCIIYGAIAAIAQKDIKRMVAYSSIGHMGYVVLGAAALTPLAMVGSVAQMVSHGLILAMLFYLVGVIEEKVGTRELDVLNGLLNPMRGLPLASGLLVVAAMASAGIPGLAGFIAEFMVFQGTYAVFPLPTLLAVLGTGLTAVYFVILLNRTCFGKLDNETAYYPKVTLAEQAPAFVLAALIVWLGVQPYWMVRWSEKTTAAIVAAVPSSPPIARTLALSTAPTLSKG